ncbi:MAG: hypothetical protein JXQ73_27145 [Phycisphaerae bacterium]|nr:hypothetical protein [Phycisphaerae bacterium]
MTEKRLDKRVTGSQAGAKTLAERSITAEGPTFRIRYEGRRNAPALRIYSRGRGHATEMTDQELILAARAGDLEAFGLLVSRYQRTAYGHALALLGEREQARDAVQDSFLAAFRALPRLEPSRPFFGWLYVVLRNRCFSILRSRRRALPLDESYVAASSESSGEDTVDIRVALGKLAAERPPGCWSRVQQSSCS